MCVFIENIEFFSGVEVQFVKPRESRAEYKKSQTVWK
jgi:hypothetical protein